jgi:hypothetical protein
MNFACQSFWSSFFTFIFSRKIKIRPKTSFTVKQNLNLLKALINYTLNF